MTGKALFGALIVAASIPVTGFAGTMKGDVLGSNEPRSGKSECGDFLDAQGSTSQFFYPVPDYVGWNDAGFITFALIDYAGLAAEFLKEEYDIDLRTRTRCSLREHERASGDREITVKLNTKRALGFALSIADLEETCAPDCEKNPIIFDEPEPIFGARTLDVANDGAEPALGPAKFKISFVLGPDEEMPDLIEVIFDGECNFEPSEFRFESRTPGMRSDGSRAVLRVSQVAAYVCDDDGNGPSGDYVYTKEVVEINPPRESDD